MVDPENPYAPPQPDGHDSTFRADWRGNIVADAFAVGTRLMFARPGLMLAMVATFWLPLDFYASYQELFVLAEDDIRGSIRMHSAISTFFGVLPHAAILAIGVATLRGEPITYGGAISAAFSNWGRFILANIGYSIAVVVGLLLLIVPGIYLAVGLVYVPSVLVAEQTSLPTAFKRSMAIANRRFWPSLAVLIATGLMFGAALLAVSVVAAVLLAVDLSGGALWVIDSLLDLPIDVVTVWTQLIVLAAYMRIRDEEVQEQKVRLADFEGPVDPMKHEQPPASGF